MQKARRLGRFICFLPSRCWTQYAKGQVTLWFQRGYMSPFYDMMNSHGICRAWNGHIVTEAEQTKRLLVFKCVPGRRRFQKNHGRDKYLNISSSLKFYPFNDLEKAAVHWLWHSRSFLQSFCQNAAEFMCSMISVLPKRTPSDVKGGQKLKRTYIRNLINLV